MPHDPYKALYLHIPFCAARCAYCDFHTKAVKPEARAISVYADWLVSEIRRLSREGELGSIETVYIGGGTPTHLGSKHLSAILYALGVSMHLTPEVECTVEANPESLDERLVQDLWALGANRLSLGVQSFDDGLLNHLGRIHTADRAREAIRAAQTRFDNVSIDLMCGLPGQTLGQFEESVRCAIELGVKHVSIYPLTIEPKTKFEKLLRRGKLELPDDDLVADMMELAERCLHEAGMRRYEVASYAYPGYESRHNMSYWTGKPYLGIGDSAVTMTQNAERRMRVQDGCVIDDLAPREMHAEDLMLAMRMTAGIDAARADEFRGRLPGFDDKMSELVSRGMIEPHEGGWRPTHQGWLFGNELFESLLDLSDDE